MRAGGLAGIAVAVLNDLPNTKKLRCFIESKSSRDEESCSL